MISSRGQHDSGDANSTESRRPIRQMPDLLRKLPTVLTPDNYYYYHRSKCGVHQHDNPLLDIIAIFGQTPCGTDRRRLIGQTILR
jgi:hypothetical protein